MERDFIKSSLSTVEHKSLSPSSVSSTPRNFRQEPKKIETRYSLKKPKEIPKNEEILKCNDKSTSFYIDIKKVRSPNADNKMMSQSMFVSSGTRNAGGISFFVNFPSYKERPPINCSQSVHLEQTSNRLVSVKEETVGKTPNKPKEIKKPIIKPPSTIQNNVKRNNSVSVAKTSKRSVIKNVPDKRPASAFIKGYKKPSTEKQEHNETRPYLRREKTFDIDKPTIFSQMSLSPSVKENQANRRSTASKPIKNTLDKPLTKTNSEDKKTRKDNEIPNEKIRPKSLDLILQKLRHKTPRPTSVVNIHSRSANKARINSAPIITQAK